jgi:transposase
VPKPFPAEFRRDVIAVARKGEASVAQVARDFGISESCLQRWLRIADREDGISGPASSDRGGDEKSDAAELRELRRRNGLKQRSEFLRRATAYFARDLLPRLGRDRHGGPRRRWWRLRAACAVSKTASPVHVVEAPGSHTARPS